jgi:hypothetical protein
MDANEPSSGGRDEHAAKHGRVSSSIMKKLEADNLEGWRRLWPVLVPVALEVIRHKLRLDKENAEGRAWSAWTSYRRRVRDGELSLSPDLEKLAEDLVCIVRNRWRRESFRRTKESSNAAVRGREGEWLPFDPADASPGPEQLAQYRLLVEELLQQVMMDAKVAKNPKKLVALRLRFEDPSLTTEEIGNLVGVDQSTFSRWIVSFRARIKRRLHESEGGWA